MGIVAQGNEEQTRLQERISADLRERSNRSSLDDAGADVDLVEDSEYLRGTRKTGRFSWFWLILIILAALALVVIFVLK